MNHLKVFVIACIFTGLSTSCIKDEISIPSYTYCCENSEIPHNGLPIIIIHTDDGDGIKDKTTWKQATISVLGNDLFGSMEEVNILLKGRGNSTLNYPKKSFTIRFDSKQKMLDMKKSKKWVFLANYRDPTLLRNDLTLWIGRQFDNLEWTPRGEFVDLMFNNNYVGNYYLCEKIGVSKQHVDIDELESADTTADKISGGYLLQLDKYYDEPNKFKTKLQKLPVEIISPNKDNCQPQHISYIQNFMNTIEQLLANGKFETLYNDYIDLPSFIDYFIVESFVGNNDFTAPHSVYLYKKRGGKLFAGPLWDFDFSTYYKDTEGIPAKAFWYKLLLKDATFRKKLKERWNEVGLLLNENIFEHLAEQKNYIFNSAIDNFVHFPYNSSVNHNNLNDIGFLIAYNKIVENLTKRFEYMTQYIGNL